MIKNISSKHGITILQKKSCSYTYHNNYRKFNNFKRFLRIAASQDLESTKIQ
ncbi:hypothetical protein HanPI659440_Chr02g0087241 [Helianthus annuus]|nr:hypothetical protein HanPI659440_Chr02g0087241 [Helianthus annuus]